MPINHPFQDLVVNLPCSEEWNRTNFLDMINLNQIGNPFRSQIAIYFFQANLQINHKERYFDPMFMLFPLKCKIRFFAIPSLLQKKPF